MLAEPQKQNKWLEQLVGEWTYESECSMGPDQQTMKSTGSDTVRSLGGMWVLCDGKGEMPGGGCGLTQMTLGYDAAKGRYVGTFIGSMMSNLWVYDGELDATERVLTLYAAGPNMMEPGKTANYKDVIEIHSPDHRTLSSYAQKDDGSWVHFMTAHYRRT
ncbi:MAG TPA: DUF1579 domain-containing protein [Gemmataceae bacterium]|nr:DUF1579 domain-containing protein [Gemmataceae bacterium]